MDIIVKIANINSLVKKGIDLVEKKIIYEKIIMILKYIEDNSKKFKEKLYLRIILNYEENFYSDLMPKDDVDKIETYHKVLDWVINVNKRIRNVALSGPYGAGKSTIIESYIKNLNLKRDKFLRISLATFNKESGDQQLIEKSILEQMIYRVDGKRTPFSRFKKIQKVTKKTVWKVLVIGLVFFGSGALLYQGSIISSFQNAVFSWQEIYLYFKSEWLNYIISIFFGTTFIIILYYLINSILRGFKIAKIKFDKTEIEFAKDDKESIYNKYLDELLYFFEETQYEVVIFEDIDRFDNPSIFTNLREINTFLNNYENINRRIIFLYAIKDDMFSDKERTKFFDFIIPVIPFVDAFNSRQIILDNFERIHNNSNINRPSDELIKDITIFLDDMRMLTNITNEYIIYYQQINGKTRDPDKLFSIITYKNLYPKDFYQLQYNDGLVKKVFDKKREFIELEIEKLEEKIHHIKKLIEIFNSTIVNSIEDLMMIFRNRWQRRGIYSITGTNSNGNSNRISILENIINNRNLFSEQNQCSVYNNNGLYIGDYTYDEIFTAFGEYHNLFIMAEAIELNKKEELERKKEELSEALKNRNEIQLISLKNLIKEYNVNGIFDEIKNERLLIFLIREGHIDETYRHYISYFYPGAITQNDMEFLRNVKSYHELGYEYKLGNVNEIIKDISADELKSKSILNNDLLEYLLNNLQIEQSQFDIFLESIIDNIDSRIDFIDQFCTKSEYKSIFINEICKKYTGFWSFIVNKSHLLNQRIESYFTWIINTCDENVIIELNENDSIVNFIKNTKNIFQIAYEPNKEEKLESILKELNIKFDLLEIPKVRYCIEDKQESESKLITYILEHNMYSINVNMIKYFYGYYVDFNEEKMNDFESKNYSAVKSFSSQYLISYLESNLTEYLKEVFLKIPQNTNEDILVIEKFLKDTNIDNEIKIEIIKKSNVTFDDLESIPSQLWDTVIENFKWNINWLNIMYYFENFKILSPNMIKQINKRDVFERLSLININKIEGIDNFSEQLCISFYKYLYENEELNDDCFMKIQNSIPNYYNYSESSKVSNNRMNLILNSYSMNFTMNNYTYLKNNYGDLYYDWVIRNFDKFLENSEDIILEAKEVKMYLNEDKISETNKINLINFNKDCVLKNIDNEELVNLIFKLNQGGIIEKLDNSIFNSLINLQNYTEERIKLLANRVKDLNEDDIKKYLNAFKEPIMLLSQKSHEEEVSVKIEKNSSIKYLIEKLVDCKYIKSYDETSESYDIKFSKNTLELDQVNL